ncbi:hypothetical protein [Geobacter sp.]|uniref:hypothetical protein n=1 Tax=Geobacter sp. TaxID=46610 RepID=UPI00260A7EF8|nr:hypothetical protein [Geobacter sp.]
MDCIALKKLIFADNQLSQIHFLLKTKAKRGESDAFVYNAGRFFDRHEETHHRAVISSRDDSNDAALCRGLVRLGLMILTAGFGILIHSIIAIAFIPLVLSLLWGEVAMLRRAYLFDRCLKEYLKTLRQTRIPRREAFLREMSQQVSYIAGCGRS